MRLLLTVGVLAIGSLAVWLARALTRRPSPQATLPSRQLTTTAAQPLPATEDSGKVAIEDKPELTVDEHPVAVQSVTQSEPDVTPEANDNPGATSARRTKEDQIIHATPSQPSLETPSTSSQRQESSVPAGDFVLSVEYARAEEVHSSCSTEPRVPPAPHAAPGIENETAQPVDHSAVGPSPSELQPLDTKLQELDPSVNTEFDRAVASSTGSTLTAKDTPSATPSGSESALSITTDINDQQDVMSTEPSVGEASKRAQSSRQYRPSLRTPRQRVTPAAPKNEAAQSDRALPIEVRVVFETGGFCRVSLLPRRLATLPTQILTSNSGTEIELVALQEDWYQDLILPDTGTLLRHGINWESQLPNCRSVRWSLSGRELYVLAPHDSLSGFVSAPRLILTEQHVVLSVAERASKVLDAIQRTGSPKPEIIGFDSGIPLGWLGFRGVIPSTAVVPSEDGNILDVLCPLPEAEIVLEGGVRIGRSAWLREYPPIIRLRGNDSAIELLIDGKEATLDGSGAYVRPGWDLPGEHTIWCISESRSYSICEGLEAWAPWDAYTWSLGDFTSEDQPNQSAICGVLVRPPRSAGIGSRTILLPRSNPILIGAHPGEIAFCRTRAGLRATVAIGFPAFSPVWALPADTLHCDKRDSRIVLLGNPLSAPPELQSDQLLAATKHDRRERAERQRAWCSMILDAGRKGLQTDPSTAPVSGLWKEYKRMAKRIWRSLT